jgi:hypothetical protein
MCKGEPPCQRSLIEASEHAYMVVWLVFREHLLYPCMVVWLVFREHLLYPYHLQQVQAVSLLDFAHAKNSACSSINNMVKIPSLTAVYSSLVRQASQGKAY